MSTVVTDEDAGSFLAHLAQRNGHVLEFYPQHAMYDLTVTVYRCISCSGIAQVARKANGDVLTTMHRLSEPCAPEEWDSFEFPAEYAEVPS